MSSQGLSPQLHSEAPLADMPPGFEQEEKKKRRNKWILLFLLLLLAFLIYLYLLLNRPPQPLVTPKTPGITHLYSIYGWRNHRLKAPDGVAFDKKGNLYISDTGNSIAAVFDNRGRFKFAFGERKSKKAFKPGELFFPLGLTVRSNGDIWVVSSFGQVLNIFNSKGKFKTNFQVKEGPVRVKQNGKKMYVTTDGPILVYNSKGKVTKRIGTFGKGIRQFTYVNGIDFDKKGNIFVSDSGNNRIQILDKKGKYIGGVGRPTVSLNDNTRLFGLNSGLAIDEDGFVYVVDSFHHAVRVFDHEGNDYGELGNQGSLDGQFNYPADIAYAGDGVFAIADKWNDRVQVVRITPPEKPKRSLKKLEKDIMPRTIKK